jgi:hypothetical protein
MERRQIQALIKADPEKVIIYRSSRVSAPGGGWRQGPLTPLPEQEITLIPFKRRMTEFLVNSELGDLPDLPYIMVGYHHLDVQRDDQFTWRGDTFVVKTVDIKEEVRIAAQVDYLAGGENRNG